MTYQEFAAEVSRAENILNAMKNYPMDRIPDVDLNVDACECAAGFGGFDITTAKMLNRKFRIDAAKAAFEMAQRAA